jgi:hypothetical protein
MTAAIRISPDPVGHRQSKRESPFDSSDATDEPDGNATTPVAIYPTIGALETTAKRRVDAQVS